MTEQDRKLAEKLFEEYIGEGQYGIDFEKKHIIEFAEAYHEARMKEVTDEDIELYARRHSLSEATKHGIIEGAKAFRDGKIKHKEE